MQLGDEDFLTRARSSCTHKAAYSTRAEITTYLRNRDFPGTIYKCPFCNQYHHTTYDRCRSKAFTKRVRRLINDPQRHCPSHAV